MSCRDPRGLPGTLLAALLAACLLLPLGACQVRPLYATAPAPGSGLAPQGELPAIAVEGSGNRVEQVFRNELLFRIRGAGAGEGEGEAARYVLAYRLTIREDAIATERDSGTPNAYQLTGSVSFLLKEAADGARLYGDSVTGADSYTRSSQNFANIRARRDAEDRLAKTLATLAEARLAAFFATR